MTRRDVQIGLLLAVAIITAVATMTVSLLVPLWRRRPDPDTNSDVGVDPWAMSRPVRPWRDRP